MAREKDDDTDRDPETEGEIHERWAEKAEISNRYTEAKQDLPDNPRMDPWAYTALPTRNPAKNITPPLWETIKSEANRIHRWSEERDRYEKFLTGTFMTNLPFCMNRMVSERLRENLIFLSSLGRYNTERRPVIRQYFDQQLRIEELGQKEVDASDVREFGDQKKSLSEESDTDFNEIFQEILLTLPEDINPQDFQEYLLFRYNHLNDPLEELGYFTIYDLLSFEALLRDAVLEDTGLLLSNLHRFESREEYAAFSDIHEPSNQFEQQWRKKVVLDVQAVLREFVEGTLPDEPTFDPNLHEERIETGREILGFLSYSGDSTTTMDFLSNPLFQLGGDSSEIVVPFPEVLLTTAQYRIEEYVSRFESVQEIENHRKGDVVEELAQNLLTQVPNRNFVKEFEFIHDPNPGEADGILFSDSSYWVIEIKSHPIFRKIPNQIELVKNRFTDKAVQAIEQIDTAQDYLESLDDEFGLMYNFTGNKNWPNMEAGGIIVLDGFIPTLFSGNERVDQELGVGQVHQHLANDDRVVILTLYDLYQLLQEEEIENIDEFLLWRTGYDKSFPIWGYSEREYWAFYFDNYRHNGEWEEALETAVEKDIVTIYTSERFNDKSHLRNLAENR